MRVDAWHLTDWIVRTRASHIGRATHGTDGSPALVKVAVANSVHFRDEYALLRTLTVPDVVHPRSMGVVGTAPAMVFEDRDVVALSDAYASAFGVGDALQVARTLAVALAGLHEADLIHGDLRPSNIVVDRSTGAASIVDLSASVERRHAVDPIAIDDWAWISPEQTGRVDRPVDHRSDFYGLGLLLYRMLTGRLAFDAADALEWAHCHTARIPAPPSAIEPAIPPIVSELVMRLLAKSPDERYRRADVLVDDLERCWEQMTTTGTVEAFSLGKHDPDDQIHSPRRLHGRHEAESALVSAFEHAVETANPGLVLVSGPSGIGKTALVRTLQGPVTAAGGYFIDGKFDSQRSDVPYATLAQALNVLVHRVLAEPDDRLTAWRTLLTRAVGTSGQLVIDVVPSLALLIGPQVAAPELAPAEAQTRLHWVLGRFLESFARRDHPLVLFLDDLQWADLPSLMLLRELAANTEAGALVVVGAYRSDELDQRHPLAPVMEQLSDSGATVTRIELAPLARADVASLVADSLHADVGAIRELAELTHAFTQGNPFFIGQFLAELHADGLLRFDPDTDRWTWDRDLIRVRHMTDDVLHVVASRLLRLSALSRSTLEHAACLGTTVATSMLATAQGIEPFEIEDSLVDAVRSGLISLHEGKCTFPHDRVREAAYALVPADQRVETHLRIGRRLLAGLAPGALDEHVFTVVDQINRGAALITDPDESTELALLNATAGRRAKRGLDFPSAHAHLARAAAAWPADGWTTRRDETFELLFDLAECEFLIAEFDAADRRLEALLAHARSPGERARIHGLRIRLLVVPGRFGDAAELAIAALESFGVGLTDDDLPEAIQRERLEVERELDGRTIDDLLNAPLIGADDDARVVLGLIVDSFAGIYISRPDIFPLLVLRATRLVLRFGNCEASAVIYTYYARVLVVGFDEIADAFEYSELALRLNEKLGDRTRRGMLLFCHAAFIQFWSRPWAHARLVLDRGFDACLEVGNFLHAGLIAVNNCLFMLEGGERLDELSERAERFTTFLGATHSEGTIGVVRALGQFARCLRGLTDRPDSFDDETYDHAWQTRLLEEQHSYAGLGIVYVLEQMATFIAGRVEASLEASSRAATMVHAIYSQASRPTHVVFRSLALAAVHPSLSDDERAADLDTIAGHLADIEVWAHHCPENYEAPRALVAAELARIRGDEMGAERLYEQAIDAARNGSLIHYEAIAGELAAGFHRSRGLDRVANMYLAEAHSCYRRWGATAKVRQLEAQRPWLAESTSGSVAVDTMAVVKASQAVSSQIDPDELLDTLMQLALVQAGAQSGRLYVVDGEQLDLAAIAEVRGDEIAVRITPPGSSPIDQDDHHPNSILNVVRRSREPILLADATTSHPYTSDPYVKRRCPQSVLCVPLVHQGQTIGALYVEHLLTTHAFSQRQATVLGVLAGQAAISLETARLYTALKRENAQRRRAEEATLEWQARVGRLVESNIIAVRIANLDGQIVEANDSYLAIVGYTRDDMAAGRLTTHGVTAPEYHEADARAQEQLVREGQYSPFEKEYVRKDGSRVPILAGGILFEGEPPQTIGFVLDLSERRRAEIEHQAREAAEAANEAKSAFLANMSHELRTPLHAVLGYAQLLRTDDDLTEPQRSGLETIEASGHHLLALIDDVLDLSRIEVGKLDLDPTDVELRTFLDHVADIIRVRAGPKGLEFGLEVEPSLPDHVQVDDRRLRQILLNLLGNAVKFTQRGNVELRVTGTAGIEGSCTLNFTVQDSGVGMTPEELERVFQPFEQSGSAVQRAQGSGLGLSICEALVREMGGAITVESEPGRGSRFSFEIDVPTTPVRRTN